jgi:hypothetical protein
MWSVPYFLALFYSIFLQPLGGLIFEDFEALLNHLMTFMSFDIDDKANSTGIDKEDKEMGRREFR